MQPRFRRDYDPDALLAAHPPQLRHPNKRTVFELACPPGATHRGPITVTRWRAAPLPAQLASTEVVALPGVYEYSAEQGVWHVNFADPELFFGYGSGLLAQDELQGAEHPLLGPVRHALIADGEPALTEEDGEPTPVLVAGVERRCEIDTRELYGNRFAAAHTSEIRRGVRLIDPPTRTNLIAIAAPSGGAGTYAPEQLAYVLVAAYTGFAAAVTESRDTPVEIRTGFWGCGAFGGNRHAMTLLQILAARLAGVARLRFYVFDDQGRADFQQGTADLDRVLAGGAGISSVLDRVAALGYEWGVGNGT